MQNFDQTAGVTKSNVLCEKITVILLCAGDSLRFLRDNDASQAKKQWLFIDEIPLWLHVFRQICDFDALKNTQKIIVSSENELFFMRSFAENEKNPPIFVAGGENRAQSLMNALQKVTSPFVLVTDIARPNICEDVLHSLLFGFENFICSAPAMLSRDAIVLSDPKDGPKSLDKNDVFLIQTPQISRTDVLKFMLKTPENFADETEICIKFHKNHPEMYEKIAKSVTNFHSGEKNLLQKNGLRLVSGSKKLQKVTFFQDLDVIWHLPAPSSRTFVGNGFDVHAFAPGKMILGGEELPGDVGFLAHSDGDVLLHALADALLGAIGAGDIGEWFPDTEPKNRNLDSKILLKTVRDFVYQVGFEIFCADITVIAQMPKISPYKQKMRKNISQILKIPENRVNLKATTTENMGFVGRGEGICVQVSVSVNFFNWKNFV